MKKQDGWVSEYRKKKFYERQEIKKIKEMNENSLDDCLYPNSMKTISVMLDLDGTSDGIDDEKARLFIKQLDFIRMKFNAEKCTISISTHYSDEERIKPVLDILSRNLPKGVEIGLSFFYGGMYNYDTDQTTVLEHNFNRDKVKTFDGFYVHDLIKSNQWFAIIDDGMDDDVYKKYKDIHPMLLCLPSQSEKSVQKNNFMRIATVTKGIDGVIEILDSYINSIKKLSSKAIMQKQNDLMIHLSSYELVQKIRNREFSFVERYFKEGMADKDDYTDAMVWLKLTLLGIQKTINKEDCIHIQNILQLLSNHFNNNDDNKFVNEVAEIEEKILELSSNSAI